MCEYCHESILIDIKDPFYKSNKKYDEVLATLEKALGYGPASGATEVMPYRSVRELIVETKAGVERDLLKLHNEIVLKWLGLSKSKRDPFKLNGKTVINPKTGKPLNKGQWKIIKKDLIRSFGYIYMSKDIDIARTAMALGRILADSPVDDAIEKTLLQMKPGKGIRIEDTDPQYRASLQFAEEQAAEDIVDLSQRQYKRFHDTVVTAQKNRATPRKLESKLFETFGDMNRDWRRIAETEIANNVNTGKLVTELAKDRVDGDYIYMKGMSGPMACKWCWNEVNDKIVVLLDEPPTGSGDQIDIDDKTYTAIWPGKDNVGRPRRDWWVAAGVQHPHCQCTWVRYEPGHEDDLAKFEAAMKQASEDARNNFVSYTMD